MFGYYIKRKKAEYHFSPQVKIIAKKIKKPKGIFRTISLKNIFPWGKTFNIYIY
ncbi:hypothetical protein MYP_1084 [Sporocytophaga myxococcoides]|uniref:Uncharacterized protein n=1 Tax=Sporocytophaga myxococcoides TaxID=153721 RepID=A0A098LAA8_9BACT|nr:hypothetical protein MYP_1084 [Sporocytophaga myxococcoides]